MSSYHPSRIVHRLLAKLRIIRSRRVSTQFVLKAMFECRVRGFLRNRLPPRQRRLGHRARSMYQLSDSFGGRRFTGPVLTLRALRSSLASRLPAEELTRLLVRES